MKKILCLLCFVILQESRRGDVQSEDKIRHPKVFSFAEKIKNNEVCFELLGCFQVVNPDYMTSLQMISIPEGPETIGVKFLVFTDSSNGELRYNFTEDDLRPFKLSNSKPTVFIVHGFLSKFDENEWPGQMKNIFLERGYNVIGVDWEKGASGGVTSLYVQAVANTKVVGAALAYFIKQLTQFTDIETSSIHIIGHSLGAHISGYAGERFPKDKIGRITGLDPAGPGFYKDINSLSLDPSDAAFVDVIHTDCGAFGNNRPMGHLDFYPNGGEKQPGCTIVEGLLDILVKRIEHTFGSFISCSHGRASEIYMNLVTEKKKYCQLVGYQCKSYKAFENGECVTCGEDMDKCALLSFDGDEDPIAKAVFQAQKEGSVNSSAHHEYYFNTDSEGKCLYHFHVRIHVYSANLVPTATITLDSGTGSPTFSNVKLKSPLLGYMSRKNYDFLLTSAWFDGNIHELTISYDDGLGPFAGLTPRMFKKGIIIQKIEVNYMSNMDPLIRQKFSSVLCPVSMAKIKQGEMRKFTPCDSN